ncbi:ATP-binding protein [Aquabacterium sp.]|uniref:ATP-binding protein n=1 Tax=Aquabacterium sp. TaxID=1872578 RepID=UPI003782FB28
MSEAARTEPSEPGTPDSAAPAPDGTRRYVTLLFSDLSGSTALSGAMEAEEYAKLLAALRKAYQQTVPRWGGTIVRVQGDGLLAMFGHPVTREDDGRRAVEAALALHEQVRRMAPPLPPGFSLQLHTGIHAGLVLIGTGDIERGRFELMGMVPNIAARLSDAAGPHEIVVSEETLGPARRFFRAGAPSMISVKGREAPILVYRIDAQGEESARTEVRSRPSAPLLGRQQELARLEQSLNDTLHGYPAGIEVAGPPGIGKTRLVEEFLGHARQHGCRVLRGGCDSGGGAPLQPFREMLQSLGSVELPGSLRDWPERLLALAREQPLVAFIDDWQWADDASRQVLAAVQQRVSGAPLLIVLTRRLAGADAAPTPGVTTLALAPLPAATAAEAVAAQLPGADPFVVAQICADAGGIPLFIEELCHSAARGDRGRLAPPPSRAGWLNQLIESRVQDLGATLADLVRTAAVIGNVVPAWLLARITGISEHSPRVRELAEQDFLFPGERAGTLRFKHGVTRDVVYASIGLLQRQLLHLRVAVALMQHAARDGVPEDVEALALHFGAGGDPVLEAQYAERAGDHALAVSALDRARSHYRTALAALDRGELEGDAALRWADIVERLCMVCMFDPERSQIGLAERALALVERWGDPARIARARHWLGCVNYALGEARTAIVQGERALAEAEQAGDEPLAFQVVASLGEACTAAGRYDRALELLERAIAVKRRHRSGRRTNVGLAYSLVCRGVVLGDRGSFAAAAACFDEALDCLVDPMHQIVASIQGWRGAVLLWQGRWRAAREAAAESARVAEATRSLWQLSIARAIDGYAAWRLDGTREAVAGIVEVTDWLLPRDNGLFRSLNHGWLAEGLQALGDPHACRRHTALALQRARLGDCVGLAMAWRAMARAAHAAGQPAAAARHLAAAHRVAARRQSAHERAVTQLCEAELAAAAGDAAGARVPLSAAMQAFDAMGMEGHLVAAQALRDRL